MTKLNKLKLSNKDIAYLYGLESTSNKAILRIKQDIIDCLELKRDYINLNDICIYNNMSYEQLKELMEVEL